MVISVIPVISVNRLTPSSGGETTRGETIRGWGGGCLGGETIGEEIMD